jgi:hypothetical protein
MWLNPARGWCRACGYQDFADSNKRDTQITAEMRAQWLQERLAREEKEKHEAEHALELLRTEQAWIKYHAMLDAYSRHWWEVKGVSPSLINYFQLGYCPSRTIWTPQGEWMTPTATIPIFAPGWVATNIRHRLIHPPSPQDKYRPERSGLPAVPFLTIPDEQPRGEVILVEGEIKAIVVWQFIDGKYPVIGLPGKRPRRDIVQILDQCDRIHIVFDPDAQTEALDFAQVIGQRARLVTLPVKPDDLFVQHSGTATDFLGALKQGRKISV